MAKKRGASDDLDDNDDNNPITFEATPVGQGLPPPFQETTAQQKTESLIEQMMGGDNAGTGFVVINRELSTNNLVSCGRVAMDRFDYFGLLDYIRDSFGPGDYRLMAYIQGRRGCVENRLVTIERAAGTAVATAQPGGDANAVLANILQQMAAENRRMAEEQNKRLEAQMAAMAKALEPKPAGPDPTMNFLKEIVLPVAMLAVPKMLERKPDNGISQLKDVLALTGTIKDLREENAAPPGDGGTDWGGVIKEGLGALQTILAQRAMAVPQQRPAIAGPGATQGPTVIEGGQPAHPLYAQVANLLQVAQQDADAEETATLLWKALNDQQRGVLIQFLDRKGALRDLAVIHPGVMDHAEWFAELRQCLLFLSDEGKNDANANVAEANDARETPAPAAGNGPSVGPENS